MMMKYKNTTQQIMEKSKSSYSSETNFFAIDSEYK